METRRGNFLISTDQDRLDIDAIHAYLSRSYWAEGIPIETVTKSIGESLCFGLFDTCTQVGFARVITDKATFAYLCDVYVLETHQGQGLGTWLMETVCSHPDLQGLRRFVLITRDAHGLYKKFGFTQLEAPGLYMEIARPKIYTSS